MARLTVGACAEIMTGERRVALVPESVAPIAALGADMAVEAGAGALAGINDTAYAQAGASVLSRAEVIDRADVLIGIHSPGAGADDRLRCGQALIGMLRPFLNPLAVRHLADHGITAISLDLMPSALGQLPPTDFTPLDAVASQARITGYEAALIAVGHCGRCLPAAVIGTTGPAARGLVVDAGPAGLQAMSTARRLGVVVEYCDTDPRLPGRVASTGADYHDLSSARSSRAVRRALTDMVPRFDMVIVTRRQPPRTQPDVLVASETIAAMRAGSVVVDATGEPGGGAVELVEPDKVVSVPPGVTVIGTGNLPSRVPRTASTAYARGATALLGRLMQGGSLAINPSDPIQGAIVLTHGGRTLNDVVWRQILDVTEVAGLP